MKFKFQNPCNILCGRTIFRLYVYQHLLLSTTCIWFGANICRLLIILTHNIILPKLNPYCWWNDILPPSQIEVIQNRQNSKIFGYGKIRSEKCRKMKKLWHYWQPSRPSRNNIPILHRRHSTRSDPLIGFRSENKSKWKVCLQIFHRISSDTWYWINDSTSQLFKLKWDRFGKLVNHLEIIHTFQIIPIKSNKLFGFHNEIVSFRLNKSMEKKWKKNVNNHRIYSFPFKVLVKLDHHETSTVPKNTIHKYALKSTTQILRFIQFFGLFQALVVSCRPANSFLLHFWAIWGHIFASNC